MAYDLDYNSVSLLLHCDGSNGSTTFTDNSPTPQTVTANGNAQVSTAQSQWGGASALFDGSGDYLSIPSGSAFDFGSGDFTIEYWLRLGTVSGTQNHLGKYSTSATSPFAIYQSNAQIGFYSSTNGTSWDLVSNLSFGSSFATNTWYHLAVTRSGTTFRTFLNGTLVNSTTASGAVISNSEPVYIGRGNNSAPAYVTGNIDDLRITKGVARYTASFSVPTAAYPDAYGFEGSGAASYLGVAAGSGVHSVGGTGAVTYTGVASGVGAFPIFGSGAITYTGTVAGVGGFGFFGAGTPSYAGTASGVGAYTVRIDEAISDTLQAGSSGNVVHPVRDEWADSLMLLQTSVYGMTISSTLSQSLLLADHVGFYAEQLIQDALHLTLSPTVAMHFPETLLDTLEVRQDALGALTFTLASGDALSLTDALRAALGLTLQDSVALSGAFAENLRFGLSSADTLDLTATPYETVTLQVTLQDTAALGDHTAETLNLYLTLRDGAILEVLAEQNDATYLCLALNLALGGATTYEAYNFPHMAHFRGHTLLGNTQGLYQVAGTDDAGTAFHATFATGLLDFTEPRAKRLQALYVGHDSAGETFIGTLSGNDRTARWYRLSPTEGDFQTERASTALGVAARYWAVEVDSEAAFEIDSIELRPVVTGRRKGG